MKNKMIVFSVSSGIAAYKMVDFVHELRVEGNEVHVVMTAHATEMVPSAEFVKASRHPVHTTLFPRGFDYKNVLEKREVAHIKLADSADIIVIAPATANVLGKIAHGMADDFLTTMVMAARAPVLLCPSMNIHMGENEAVQENLRLLEAQGYFLLHPDSGRLACGYDGVGRLADPAKIKKELRGILTASQRLKGKKIVITAGGTREAIDAVRVISNRGSGKMGAALARACALQGADVLLLRAATAVSCPRVKETVFETAEELDYLLRRHVKKADIVFHTAAVGDYSIENRKGKLDSTKPVSLTLVPREKIITRIKQWNPHVCLVGFKAEYRLQKDQMIQKAKESMEASGAAYVVANDIGVPGIGFGSEDNEVYIVSRKSTVHVAKSTKGEIAARIIDAVVSQPSAAAS